MKTKTDFANNWHVMSTSIFPYIRAYYVRKNKLFYQEMVEIMGILEQSGLYNYQKRHNFGINNENNAVKNITKKHHAFKESDEKPLTMGHLQLAFILLLLGYVLATTAFIGEHVVFYSCNKNK